MSSGTNQNIDIQTTRTDKTLAKLSQAESLVDSRRLVQNQAAELAREPGASLRAEGAPDGQRRLERPRRQRLLGQHPGRAQLSRSRPPSCRATGRN